MSGPPSPSSQTAPREILGLLPGDSSPSGLDYDGALEGASAPRLPFPDGSFDLIWSLSAFTRIADGWAKRLLEARRLLSDSGVLVVGLAGPEAFERLTGSAWEEPRVGMTVLSAMNGAASRVVFHSEW